MFISAAEMSNSAYVNTRIEMDHDAENHSLKVILTITNSHFDYLGHPAYPLEVVIGRIQTERNQREALR